MPMHTTTSPPTYYWEIEQGTDEWHALRRGRLTASAIGALITPKGKVANNATSRVHLLKLLAERVTGVSDPSFYNDDMMRGHLLEPYARDLYSRHYAPVRECGFVLAQAGGAELGYSPDGLVGDDGLIEIKSRLAKHHLAALLASEMPSEYTLQIQTGLAVTGRSWCDFISYTPGLPLFVHRCQRDEQLIAQLIAAAQAAEEQLSELYGLYLTAAKQFPATEPIQLEPEEIIV
jgi:putative phage-type endonuclease